MVLPKIMFHIELLCPVEIVSRGHYPDTVIIYFDGKTLETYLKCLTPVSALIGQSSSLQQ